MNKIRVPQSRFIRELNKWVKYLNKNPLATIYITRNKQDTVVFISPTQYKFITQQLKRD